MNRRPRNARIDHLVNSKLATYSYLQIGVTQAVGAFLSYFTVMAEEGWLPITCIGLRKHWEQVDEQELEDSYGQEWTFVQRQQQEFVCYTAFFVAIVIQQLADLVIRKTRRNSVFTQGLFRNKVVLLGMLSQLVIAAFLSYCPGMDEGLHFMPLRVGWWFVAISYAIFIWLYDEMRKFFIRRYPECKSTRKYVLRSIYYHTVIIHPSSSSMLGKSHLYRLERVHLELWHFTCTLFTQGSMN
uniref:Cation-transporting P-type ATPase C-terminal domain-containing protein n=1 Tax=Petromyzon marinus TaxID=7757 RepID=S4R8S6_PETMA